MYSVPDQSGRRFVVTGSNSGTGKETAKRLAAAGAHVVMAVRTPSKGEDARLDILREIPGARIEVRRVDLADLASVREFADGILSDGAPIDVLVNNAGVMSPPKRLVTTDGFELQFGSNFLGPLALTNLLLPRILKSKGARIATMSSGTANFGSIRFDDLQWAGRYSPFRSYAQSKLADMLAAQHLATIAAERGWDLLSTTAHPGYTRTNLQSSGANLAREGREKPPIQRTILPSQDVSQGAEPLLFAATSPDAMQGAYYGPGGAFGLVGPTKRAQLPRSAKKGPDLAASLWAVGERLTGTRLPDRTAQPA